MKSFRNFLTEDTSASDFFKDMIIRNLKLTDEKHLNLFRNRNFLVDDKFKITSSTIFVPNAEIIEQMKNEGASDDYLRALFEEEVIHSWHIGAATRYDEKDEETADRVIKRAYQYYVESVGHKWEDEFYGGDEPFLECIRQIVQKDLFGRTTEEARGFGEPPNTFDDLTPDLQWQVTATKNRVSSGGDKPF